MSAFKLPILHLDLNRSKPWDEVGGEILEGCRSDLGLCDSGCGLAGEPESAQHDRSALLHRSDYRWVVFSYLCQQCNTTVVISAFGFWWSELEGPLSYLVVLKFIYGIVRIRKSEPMASLSITGLKCVYDTTRLQQFKLTASLRIPRYRAVIDSWYITCAPKSSNPRPPKNNYDSYHCALRSNFVLNELVARLSPSGLCRAEPRWFETRSTPPLFIRSIYLLLYELAFFDCLLVFRAGQCRMEGDRIVKDDVKLC